MSPINLTEIMDNAPDDSINLIKTNRMANDYHSLTKALYALRLAEDELSRPEEDVMTTCSCHFTRAALNGLLLAYLQHRGTQAGSDLSATRLLDLCAQIDSRFAEFDLSVFDCSSHVDGEVVEVPFCDSLHKGNQCLDTTRSIKVLVMAGLGVKESDF